MFVRISGPRPVGKSEIHGRRFAVGVGLRGVEVGVTIDEQQAAATSSPQCEEVAQEDGAVAAEHHGNLAAIDHLSDGVGQRRRIGCDSRRVQGSGHGIALEAIRRLGLHPPGMTGAQSIDDPLANQRLRKELDARWFQAEDRWRFDKGKRSFQITPASRPEEAWPRRRWCRTKSDNRSGRAL